MTKIAVDLIAKTVTMDDRVFPITSMVDANGNDTELVREAGLAFFGDDDFYAAVDLLTGTLFEADDDGSVEVTEAAKREVTQWLT